MPIANAWYRKTGKCFKTASYRKQSLENRKYTAVELIKSLSKQIRNEISHRMSFHIQFFNNACNLVHFEFVFCKRACFLQHEPVLVRIIIVKQLVFWLPNLFIISFTVSLINPIEKRIHQCALQLEDWLNEMLNSVWVSVQIFLTSYQRIVKFSTIEIHLKNVNRRRDKNVYEVKFIAQVLEVSHLNKLLP